MITKEKKEFLLVLNLFEFFNKIFCKLGNEIFRK